MAATPTYTIGKVVSKLERQYPDLTVSKIRFLEAQGLLNPKRTKSGYRTYTAADIERLETILKLQQSCFYPLSVIKERLDAKDSGEVLSEISPTDSVAADEELRRGTYVIDDLSVKLDVPITFIRSLADTGLLCLGINESGRSTVDGCYIPIITAAFELNSYGLDPRFLKPYVQRVNRELPSMKQVLQTSLGRNGSLADERARAVFDSTLQNLLHLTGVIGSNLLEIELRREFKYPVDL